MRFNPFPPVKSTYGAPMGRRSDPIDARPFKDVCVSLPQGEYDSGGAYWGTSKEGPVYAVWVRGKGRDGVAYVRAHSINQAKLLAGAYNQ